MVRKIAPDFANPDYPVSVKFIEIKRNDENQDEWVVRKNEVELLVVNNGELRVYDQKRMIQVSAGQGAFIFCDTEYKIMSSRTEDTAYYSLVISPSFAIDVNKDNSLAKKYYFPLVNDSRMKCFLLDEANLRDEFAMDKINDIIAANTACRPGYELMTKSYICALWGLLVDFTEDYGATFNGRNVPSQDELRVRSAIAYMKEAFADPITLEDIADKIHVSRNECCRCFKRVLDISPVDYLIKMRVFQAAKIMYKDPLRVSTISELGFQCGFNNTSYFNRVFKKYFECTPTEYKEMLKREPDRARKLFDDIQETVTGI